jgi:hypothetical protein
MPDETPDPYVDHELIIRDLFPAVADELKERGSPRGVMGLDLVDGELRRSTFLPPEKCTHEKLSGELGLPNDFVAGLLTLLDGYDPEGEVLFLCVDQMAGGYADTTIHLHRLDGSTLPIDVTLSVRDRRTEYPNLN